MYRRAAEPYDNARNPAVNRLAATAAAASRAAVSAAVSAADAAACGTPEIDQLIDELARIFAVPVNVYQREVLAAALAKAIDSRIAGTHSLS